MPKSTSASDPLYHDVNPEYERYMKLFLMLSFLICFTSIICAVVKAQDQTRFYVIIISLVVSVFFVLCVYIFFKRRILLAEKLWFVNLTIFILFLQALIYLIFVFINPYPAPLTTTRITPTHTTPSHNTSNSTKSTNTTTRTSTSTTKRYGWGKQTILTKLYDFNETRNIF